jgi:hypothetical protein
MEAVRNDEGRITDFAADQRNEPMIKVGRRIHEHLVYIDDEPCTKTKARKATFCVHSRKPINPGDWVYRPFSNSSIRSARWLASEVEAAERRADPQNERKDDR